MTLREVLHAHIPTLTMQSSFRDAVDKMDIYQFPALVVVDEEKRPTHVVTEGDLCRGVHRADSVVSLSNDFAYRLGSADPQTANVDTEIGDAFHQMLNSGLTILPVEQDGMLVGIVLRVDLMQAMLMDRHDSA